MSSSFIGPQELVNISIRDARPMMWSQSVHRIHNFLAFLFSSILLLLLYLQEKFLLFYYSSFFKQDMLFAKRCWFCGWHLQHFLLFLFSLLWQPGRDRSISLQHIHCGMVVKTCISTFEQGKVKVTKALFTHKVCDEWVLHLFSQCWVFYVAIPSTW